MDLTSLLLELKPLLAEPDPPIPRITALLAGHAELAEGEVVRAFVVRRPGQAADAEALAAWCRDSMAPYKVPREVRFLGALPATGAGKVLRRLLRDMA